MSASNFLCCLRVNDNPYGVCCLLSIEWVYELRISDVVVFVFSVIVVVIVVGLSGSVCWLLCEVLNLGFSKDAVYGRLLGGVNFVCHVLFHVCVCCRVASS